jgi:prephenate dehydrogenase
MEPPFTLSKCRIAILGLGLMGGSLAMALKGKSACLYGVDPDPGVIDLALEERIIDRGSTYPEEIVPEADLIVLAAPVTGILDLIEDLPRLHPGRPVVLDLGSTKQQIIDAMEELPNRFEAVGGHPMCGKEVSGLQNAEPGLFRQAPFVLIRLPRTTPRALRLAEQLIQAVEARSIMVEAETHDRWAAASSHLPYLLACALTNATPQEAYALIGPGFRSATRLAAASTKMMHDILLTNTAPILESMARFRREIDRLEELLKSEDWPALDMELERAAWRQKDLSGGKS